MSVEVVPGGQRRIDRVLDRGFTEGVDRLGLPELRARREEAETEEPTSPACAGSSRAGSTSSGPSWTFEELTRAVGGAVDSLARVIP